MRREADQAESHEAERVLRALLSERHVGVLATQSGGQPYASLVAFVADDEMRHLLFATPRPTRKFANLEAEPRVAMLIDSRGNEPEDLHRAAGATAVGSGASLPASSATAPPSASWRGTRTWPSSSPAPRRP